jgi:acetyl esterase/lipase
LNTQGWIAICLSVASALCSDRCVAFESEPPKQTIPLYDATTAAASSEIDEQFGGSHVVRNVTEPNLTLYLPDPKEATGAAVIIAPGGAFMMLTIDNEGHDVARRLALHGIAAFVLKYRLESTPVNDALYAAVLAKRLFDVRYRTGIDLPQFPGEALGVADASQAMRVARQRASQWRLDPNRIGFLGFSAGAIIALHLAGESDGAIKPAFVAALYGLKSFAGPVRSDSPPLFIAIAADDPFFPTGATDLYAAWRKADRPSELHIYDAGGHGFGLKPTGKTSDHWIDEFEWWLQERR